MEGCAMSEAGGNVSARQSAFYGRLYSIHGEGVDAVASGNQAYKELRYEKLCRLFSGDRSFSLHDVGCGIGHLRDYLDRHHAAREIAYSGSEITPEFVTVCRERFPDSSFEFRDL